MPPSFARPIDQLSRSHEPEFGGKSANLGELLAAEIPVPPGFALSTAAYEAFVAHNQLQPKLADPSPALGDAMRAASMPDEVRAEVTEQYARLGDDVPVAVRSSAIGEDSAEATFAGQQDTYLWVRGADRVCDAVRDCWASLYSPTAISYRSRLSGAADSPAMGVTVQLMVDAEVSGVMFTCNPVSGDPSMVAINASWGLGLAVVGGEVTPDDYLVSKVTRELVREHVHDKELQYIADSRSSGAVRVAVPEDKRKRRCLEPPALERLVEVARRIERHFGCHQDIEWAIDHVGELFMLQARPVTSMPKKPDRPKAESAMSLIMSTFGAGPPKN